MRTIILSLLAIISLFAQSRVIVNPFPPGSSLEYIPTPSSGPGSGTVSAAGCGLVLTPTSATVAQSVATAAHNGSYAILTGDCGKSLTTNTAAAWTIAQSGTAGFEAGKYWILNNVGVGSLTVTATTSTFYGGPSANISGSVLTVPTLTSATIISDGANYQVLSGGGGVAPNGSSTDILTSNGVGGFGTSLPVPLAANKGGTGLSGSLTGARKANGAGVDTQAACADLSNAGSGCSSGGIPSGTGAVYSNSGVGTLVSGTASNCVLVNGTSAPCDAPGQAAVANVTPVTVSANVTSAQVLQQLTLTAGLLNVAGNSGGVYTYNGSGIYTAAALQTPTLTWVLNACTVSGCSSGTVRALATVVTPSIVTATNNTWNIRLHIANTATGASGTLLAHGSAIVELTAASDLGTASSDSNTTSTAAIDLTGVIYLQLTVTTSTGNAGNTITEDHSSLEPASAIGPTGAAGAGTPLVISNEGVTGTTLNTLTQITSAQKAIIASVATRSGVVGITTSGAGTTSNATVTTSGSTSCVFDTAITSGDYVQMSPFTAGNCSDAGVNYPNVTTGQVVGRVLSATNASTGTYTIDLFPAEIQASTPLLSPYAMLTWYAAIAGINNASVHVLGLGDSVMQGTGATTPTTQGWFPLMKIRNQSNFNDRGDGWEYFPGVGQSCGVATKTVNSPLCQWATSGVWSAVTNWGPSPGNSPGGLWSGASGATATLSNAKFDGIDIFYATDTGTASGCSYNIDSGGPVTFGNTTTGSRTWAHTGFVSASLGIHSTVLTSIGSASCEILGVELSQGSTGGIIFDNIALSGTGTTGWCGFGAGGLTAQFGWVSQLPTPSLIMEGLGTNDFGGISPATFKSQLSTCLSTLQTDFPVASLLLISPQNQSGTGFGGASMQQYYQAKRQLASQYNTAYINVGDRWGTWSNANSLGLQSAGGGGALHPSSIGHWDWSEWVMAKHDQYTGFFPNQYSTSLASAQGLQITNSQSYGCRAGDPAPTISFGAAANSTTAFSSTGGATPSGTPCDFSGYFVVNTTCTSCSAGSASSEFVRITFGTAKANTPVCFIVPIAAVTATETGTQALYFNQGSSNGTRASFYAGSVKPADNSILAWSYHCDGQ